MAVIFSLAAEAKITSAAGTMTIALSSRGMVQVTCSWPRREVHRSLDYLKALKSAVKQGKSPKGFKIFCDPPGQTRKWWKAMIMAAEDAVKRYQNDLVEFAPPSALEKYGLKLRSKSG